ncbi:MAG: hypothetical protein Q9227_003385 [Pyrenula ochraceoflavens]
MGRAFAALEAVVLLFVLQSLLFGPYNFTRISVEPSLSANSTGFNETGTSSTESRTHSDRNSPSAIVDITAIEALSQSTKDLDHSPILSKDEISEYTLAIINAAESLHPRLECPQPDSERYKHLVQVLPSRMSRAFRIWSPKPKYFFALDLWQVEDLLPTLLGALYETLAFLGPENCVVSIVEGRSTDGTIDILREFKDVLDTIGTKYHLLHNQVDPKDPSNDRIEALANLRNQALLPLTKSPNDFAPDTVITFINDVYVCSEDILEMLHQHKTQKAHQMCGMDWVGGFKFYDSWISRGINGDTFFEMSQNAGTDFPTNLFWNDKMTRERFDKMKPFQVFSCWNGITTLTAEPFLKRLVQFRRAREEIGECFEGEPTVLARDFWTLGYTKIGIVPSVNVGYTNLDEGSLTKREFGTVTTNLDVSAKSPEVNEMIQWLREPPGQIKCFANGGAGPIVEETSWSKPPRVPGS